MGNLLVARYETDAGQNIPNDSIEVVNFEDIYFDPYGAVTVGAGWVFTAPHEGHYYCTAAILFAVSDLWTVNEEVILYIYKEGAEYSRIYWNDHMTGANINAYLRGSDLVDLAAGETMDFRVYQVSDAAITLNPNAHYNHCSIFKV